MLREKTIILLTAILLSALQATAQVRPSDYEKQAIIEAIMENAAECDNDNEADQANSLINSEHILRKALANVNINSDNPNQLMEVPTLTEIQANKICDYKKNYGNIGSMAELKSVLGESDANMRWLTFFVKTDTTGNVSNKTLKELLKTGRHTIVTTAKTVLESQKGYQEDENGDRYYEGSPIAWCVKYRFNTGNKIALGITLEKDAGEALCFGKRRYGFDFNSGFLKIDDCGKMSRLLIGDYTATFGQGLILGGGIGMGKFASGFSMASSGNCIREYGSTNEYNFMRGAATTFRLGGTSISAFAGANLTDAACDDSSTFHAFKTSGLHRNEQERLTKDNLRETHAGIIVSHLFRNFRIGAATHYFCYDKTLVPKDEIRNANLWEMRQGLETAISYHYAGRQFAVYGETALDAALNLATINFVDFAPASNIKLSIMQRKYSERYQAMKASSYSENSRVCNEEGIYAGAQVRINKYVTLNAWADIYRLPWLSYRINEPTTGHECKASADIRIARLTSMQIKGRIKSKQSSDSGRVNNGYLKMSLSHYPFKVIRITTAAQWSHYKSDLCNDHGYLIYQNYQYASSNRLIAVSARVALFSAPYNARIYSYENDVSFFFSAPAYCYKGARYYLVLGTRAIPKTTVQIRLSQWRYFDRDQISSGQNLIEGNHKTELSMYVKHTF